MPQIRPLERDSRVAYKAAHKLIVLRRLCNHCLMMLVLHQPGKRAKVWGWAIAGALLLHLVVLDIWSSGQEKIPLDGRAVVVAHLQASPSAGGRALAEAPREKQDDLSAPVGKVRRTAVPAGQPVIRPVTAQSAPALADAERVHESTAPVWRPLTFVEAQAQWRMDVLMQVRPPPLPPAGLVLRISLPLGESIAPELVRSSGREEVDMAWRIAMVDAVRRVPPPPALAAQGATVEFEWLP